MIKLIGVLRPVHVKDIDSHSVRALLASRALLVKIKRDLENQIRGLLKNLGLVIGRAKFNVFAVRAEELIEDRLELMAAVRPLLEVRCAPTCVPAATLPNVPIRIAKRSQVSGGGDMAACAGEFGSVS